MNVGLVCVLTALINLAIFDQDNRILLDIIAKCVAALEPPPVAGVTLVRAKISGHFRKAASVMRQNGTPINEHTLTGP